LEKSLDEIYFKERDPTLITGLLVTYILSTRFLRISFFFFFKY